jgi:formylglycine-generating enzyme required for sulfatase activity
MKTGREPVPGSAAGSTLVLLTIVLLPGAVLCAQRESGGQSSNAAAIHPRVAENAKDGLEYVWIPPGSFTMGCSRGDHDCFAEENPAHSVTLTKGFWLSRTEVTVRAYRQFAGIPEAAASASSPAAAVREMAAVDVTWEEAAAYCAWAGGRLPTEAEWEYAARSGSEAPRYGDPDRIAWYEGNSLGTSHAVGQREANAFGLFDMLGNVWEWVADWYAADYYAASPATDPAGPTSGRMRVLRGGSWLNPESLVRASDRARSDPDVRFNYFGFRCVGPPGLANR